MENDSTVDAKILWEYMQLNESARSCDVLLVLGSIDDRVAVHAAELSKRHKYGCVVFSGGDAHSNDLLATSWQEKTEAEHFAAVYEEAGGMMENVLLEKQAQHTGENATLTYALLQDCGVAIPKTLQLVTKPYMERRARATFEMQWPDKRTKLHVTSPRLSFEEYFTNSQPFEKIVHVMVGDYERIQQYPERGLQTKQPLSRTVEQAYIRLVRAGYTKHVLQNNNNV